MAVVDVLEVIVSELRAQPTLSAVPKPVWNDPLSIEKIALVPFRASDDTQEATAVLVLPVES